MIVPECLFVTVTKLMMRFHADVRTVQSALQKAPEVFLRWRWSANECAEGATELGTLDMVRVMRLPLKQVKPIA
jgi:hypothetical protein